MMSTFAMGSWTSACALSVGVSLGARVVQRVEPLKKVNVIFRFRGCMLSRSSAHRPSGRSATKRPSTRASAKRRSGPTRRTSSRTCRTATRRWWATEACASPAGSAAKRVLLGCASAFSWRGSCSGQPNLLLLDEATSDLDTASEHSKSTCSFHSQRSTFKAASMR